MLLGCNERGLPLSNNPVRCLWTDFVRCRVAIRWTPQRAAPSMCQNVPARLHDSRRRVNNLRTQFEMNSENSFEDWRHAEQAGRPNPFEQPLVRRFPDESPT